ncbi:MAG: Ig-like domain-containing protein, partial [Lachnospiraceae bacterium]|nr:Ig-like domain-containing protein [Lachnospiraceae bacterium]
GMLDVPKITDARQVAEFGGFFKLVPTAIKVNDTEYAIDYNVNSTCYIDGDAANGMRWNLVNEYNNYCTYDAEADEFVDVLNDEGETTPVNNVPDPINVKAGERVSYIFEVHIETATEPEEAEATAVPAETEVAAEEDFPYTTYYPISTESPLTTYSPLATPISANNSSSTLISGSTIRYTVSTGSSTATGVFTQNIKVKESVKLTYGQKNFSLEPESDAGDEAVFSYISGSSKIVTVDNNGLLTACGYGSTEITVTAKAVGKYKANSVKVEVKVVPQKVKIKYCKAKNGVLKLEFSKAKNITKYEIFIKNGSKNTKLKTKKTSLVGAVVKGKTYKIKVRAYKKEEKKKYYGNWSKVKKVKA